MAHGVEGREHGGRREYDDQRLHRALEDAHLRRVLAGEQVVLRVHPETAEVEVGGELYRRQRHPRDQHDEGDQQHVRDPARDVALERRHGERGTEEKDHEGEAADAARPLDERAEEDLLLRDDPREEREQHGVHRDREQDRDD